MNSKNTHYIRALRFKWLTKHYDRIVSLTTREKFFKGKLVEQSQLEDGFEVLDVGSGTGVIPPFLTDAKNRIHAAIKGGRPPFALCGLS